MSRFIEESPLMADPYAFVQWKGTDLCMDFHCKCGAHCHFDGYFAYLVQCPHCDQRYEMPCFILPRAVDGTAAGHDPLMLQADEDLDPAPDDA